MKRTFSISLFGYKKRQVKDYITGLKSEHESDLAKQKDRIVELVEENRRLKEELKIKNEKIASLDEQERYISKVLVVAEEKAQRIIEEGKRKSIEELYKLKEDKEKWYGKFREVRSDLLSFLRILVELLDKFRDEINYYASQEISDVVLIDENDQGENDIEKEKKVIA
ncbi:MAG: DivIVA domain-containing protein [Caldicoprobacterales bacterium]|jgi:hypothetical protein|nr:DivIVA domain-containing protein [Clostridia bacterium]MDI9511660.1 DivIVA domain-containing protein [Bacillota bacterium]